MKNFALTVVAVWLAGIACVLPGGLPTVDPNEIQTQVAQTLTVMAGGPSETPSTTLPPESHGDTPSDALEPTASPTPEPPHQRILYTKDGNIWIKDQDTPVAPLTFSGGVVDAALSDDGLIVAYVKKTSDSDPPLIGVVNTDGTGDHVILTAAQLNALYPLDGTLYTDISSLQFLPGSHYILVTTKKAFEGPGLIKYDDLIRLDADSGVLSTLLAPGAGGEIYPSPDGVRLAIARGENVAIANADGSGLTSPLVTFPGVLTYSEYKWYPQVVWKPDSAQAGVIIPSPEQLSPNPSGTIWLINPADNSAAATATFSGKFLFPLASLSPDLQHFSYLKPSTGPDSEFVISDLSGASVIVVAPLDGAITGWSTQGEYFSYHSGAHLTQYFRTLAGGTTLIGADVVRMHWISDTKYLYVTGTMAAWTLRLGEIGGASSVIDSGSGFFPILDADY